jgi:hypothetical protein
MPRATPPTNRSSAPRPTISKETKHTPSPTSMMILLRLIGGMFMEPFSQESITQAIPVKSLPAPFHDPLSVIADAFRRRLTFHSRTVACAHRE